MSMVEPLKMATPMTNLGLVQQLYCCLLAAMLTEERGDRRREDHRSRLHPLPHLVARRRPRAGGARPVRQVPQEARRPAARRPRRRGGHRPAPQLAARRSTTSPSTSRRSDGRSGRARCPVRAAHRRQVLVDHGADVGHGALDVAARHRGDGEGGDHLHRRVGHGEDDDHPKYLLGVARPGGVHLARAELLVAARRRWTCRSPSRTDLEKRTKDTFGPPAGKKLLFFVDDLNMPKVDTYGTQQPIALLKLLIDKGFLYDRGKDLTIKYIKDLQFIGAMVPGRNDVDPRFMRLSNTFAILPSRRVDQEDLPTILHTFFSTGAFATELQGDDFSHKVTGVAMEVFNEIVTALRRRPPSSTTSSTCATSPASSRACSASPRQAELALGRRAVAPPRAPPHLWRSPRRRRRPRLCERAGREGAQGQLCRRGRRRAAGPDPLRRLSLTTRSTTPRMAAPRPAAARSCGSTRTCRTRRRSSPCSRRCWRSTIPSTRR